MQDKLANWNGVDGGKEVRDEDCDAVALRGDAGGICGIGRLREYE